MSVYALYNVIILRPLREVTPKRLVQCTGPRLSRVANADMRFSWACRQYIYSSNVDNTFSSDVFSRRMKNCLTGGVCMSFMPNYNLKFDLLAIKY